MKIKNLIKIKNSQPIDYKEIPLIEITEFRKIIIKNVESGSRLNSLFGVPEKHFSKKTKKIRLFAVLINKNNIYLVSTIVGKSYKALTPECIQAHIFEREIWEQYGVIPEDHPFLKPLRFHKPNKDALTKSEGNIIGSTDFYQINGVETHEVAVGPVHAGVIEPGHFRFQCHGENIYNLEISLGYQHRGIEAALISGPNKKTALYMETIAGDTTIGHTTAYSQIIEAFSKTKISERAEIIRAIALELERIANHVGDLGALSGDAGYLPTNSFCGRIRGEFLNLTADICGNRFGRGLVKPGGVKYDIDESLSLELSQKIKSLMKDAKGAISLLWESTSVLSRFESLGIMTEKTCTDLGIVGFIARACNIEQDCRADLPFGIYKKRRIAIATNSGGDVFSRAYIRWLEIENSANYILELLKSIPKGKISPKITTLNSNKITVSLTEGWRGEICHIALTDNKGKFIKYKIVDPSFHNWIGMSIILRQEKISDFPLCNKSFNLSYCGHDL